MKPSDQVAPERRQPNPKGSLRRLARLLADNWREGWQAISCLRRGYARRKEWMAWAVSAPVGVLACLAATLWQSAKEWPEEPTNRIYEE